MKKLLKNCNFNGSPLNLLINNEYIESTGSILFPADSEYDLKGKIVLPGMIDLHTHIRDLGQSYKEDWTTASKAALSGGVTTVFDMPNTVPPTDTLEHLEMKRQVAVKSSVNYGIYAGATPHNLADLRLILEEGRIAGIKIFMAASSSNEVISDEHYLKKIFQLAKEFDKPVLTHCELHSCIESREKQFTAPSYNSVKFHSIIRDRKCAYKAVKLALKIAAEVGNSLMVLHVSTREEMELIREYKQHGDFPLYCEVTPHHLFLDEEVLETAGNFGKVNPPLRSREDADALFGAVIDGVVDTIGSDHAPHGLKEKQLEYRKAPSGFPGLETSLPLLINRHLTNNDISIERIIELTSRTPSIIMRTQKRGELKPGYFADITVIDPEAQWSVVSENFNTKAKYSPYEGMSLRGKVIMTMVNGEEKHPQGQEVMYD